MNLGRPIQFDPDVAVAKAIDVFWANGYDATSTASLMEAMSLSKSSLYQTFGSKHELFMRCLHDYSSQNHAYLRRELDEAKSAKGFLIDFFRNAISGNRKDNMRGCLLVNTACEFGISNKSTADFIKTEVSRMADLFQDVIGQAQADGEIAADKNAKHLADSLMVSLYGIRVLGKLNPGMTEMGSLMNQLVLQLE